MANQVISATEVTRHFSDILNRVKYQGQSFDIKRGREVIARLVPAHPAMPANRFKEFLNSLPELDAEDREDFAKALELHRKNMKDVEDKWG
ncbi:MAG: type II toxin-antitoxin system Phd/YefM family antitoxin [Burkholderiales bacterium]